MARAPAFPANSMIAALAGIGDLRLWSLVITIFGDSVHPRGGVVAARVLGEITGRIGIRPGALRVALHRLAQDGWITRQRHGRLSYCRLTAAGRAEFGPAAARIYARTPALTGPWRLAALPAQPAEAREAAGRALGRAGFVALGPGLWLGAAQAGPPPGQAVVVEGRLESPPHWAREALAYPGLVQEYARLALALATLEDALADHAAPAPLDALALRTLCVHHWRRLLLRHADLPARFFPADWQGETCRARMLRLHATLSPGAERWLAQHFAVQGQTAGA